LDQLILCAESGNPNNQDAKHLMLIQILGTLRNHQEACLERKTLTRIAMGMIVM
jgi:hypothetical protein